MRRRDQLAIALLDDELVEAEAAELATRCRHDPRLARILAQLMGIDALLRADFAREAQAAATRDAVLTRLRRNAATGSSSQRMASAVLARITPMTRRRPRLIRGALAAAAILVGTVIVLATANIGESETVRVVVTTAVGAYGPEHTLSTGVALPADADWTVDADGHLDLAWPDGTTVRLTGPAGGRAVADGLRLDRGRLRAAVRPRGARPVFAITTPHCRIAVVGTRFTVATSATATEVAVENGTVAVQEGAAAGPVLLTAGERLSSTGAPAAAPLPTGLDLAPPWRVGSPGFSTGDGALTVTSAYRHRYGGAPLVRTARWRPSPAAPPLRWADRARPEATWTAVSGAALEADLALATALSADLWLVVPVHADHSWISGAARMVAELLPTERRLYLQYGDRVADPRAPAGAWVRARVDHNEVAARLYVARRIRALHAAFAAAMNDPSRLHAVVPGWGDPRRTVTLLDAGTVPGACLAIDLAGIDPDRLAAWFALARTWELQPLGCGLGAAADDTTAFEQILHRWRVDGGGPLVTRLPATNARGDEPRLLRILRHRAATAGRLTP